MNDLPDILISKSRYLSGLRCDKLLWCTYHWKELFPPVSKATEGRFAQGHEIGEIATRLFPGGKEAAPGKHFAEDTVPATRALLKRRIPVFEAGFVHGAAYVMLDILNPVGEDQWDLYEVKSTTGYSPEKHLADVAIQRYAAGGSGLKVRSCYLMHVNNQYVLRGEVDPEGLLTAEEITADVDGFIGRIGGDLERMLEIVQASACPEVPVGPHCLEIRTCDLYPVCWKDLPEHHPVTLYSGKRKGFDLLGKGISDIREIGRDVDLSGKQRIQVEAARTGEPSVDASQVKRFLDQLKYPLSFLDFETLGPAVPLFEGTRPYQPIPFQFSLHVAKEPGMDPVHYAFLAEGTVDPRPALIESLAAALPEIGSVIAYNTVFEKRVLRDLAELDPASREWVKDVNDRMVDLLKPFRSFAVYHPSQRGSASMKAVLPALTDFGYQDIDMGGEEAGYEFIRVMFGNVAREEAEKVRSALEDYCKLDTEGMVHILEELRKLAGS